MYENWTIEKSILNYSGTDEELQKKAEEAHQEYSTVAEWCNNGGEYHIEDAGEYYHTVKNPEPTQEELIQQEISELKAYLTVTDYVAIKIAEGEATADEYAEVLTKRKEARARINELEEELDNLS